MTKSCGWSAAAMFFLFLFHSLMYHRSYLDEDKEADKDEVVEQEDGRRRRMGDLTVNQNTQFVTDNDMS